MDTRKHFSTCGKESAKVYLERRSRAACDTSKPSPPHSLSLSSPQIKNKKGDRIHRQNIDIAPVCLYLSPRVSSSDRKTNKSWGLELASNPITSHGMRKKRKEEKHARGDSNDSLEYNERKKLTPLNQSHRGRNSDYSERWLKLLSRDQPFLPPGEPRSGERAREKERGRGAGAQNR